MRRSLADTLKRIVHFIQTWERLRPHKSFGGRTLDQFRKEVQPALDIAAQISALDIQMRGLFAERDQAIAHANEVMLFMVDGVRGDPGEGSNGELYAALGYVTDRRRKSGLVRRRKSRMNDRSGSTDQPAR